MQNNWLNELQTLLNRFSMLGIGQDVSLLGEVEAWGLYCFLKRLAES